MASSTAPLLPYQRTVLQQLTERDGLLILARGLGLQLLVARLLKVYEDAANLVLVINATPEEERGLGEELGMRLKCIGHDSPSKDRAELYSRGGILSVTSRIIVVDMLNKVVPVDKITGLVVLHAENVKPTSTEAFIVRVFREQNRTGFIKAFSDQPEQFHFGTAPLATVLTQLKLRDVYLWPRFHNDVSNNLGRHKADVIELYQPLTDAMMLIQQAIYDCIEATLAEIRRSNAAGMILQDAEDFCTVDNALFKSFDTIIRSQLDPSWHKIGPKTKQLVSDLTTLRKLVNYQLQLDCVSFNQFLETILSTNSTNPVTGAQKQNKSPWLYLPAAETMIREARKRVYLKADEIPRVEGDDEVSWQNGKTTNDNRNQGGPSAEEEEALLAMDDADMWNEIPEGRATPAPLSETAQGKQKAPEEERKWWMPLGTKPVLEEQPKWALLAQVMEEIEANLHWSEAQDDTDTNPLTTNTVLIMCDSPSTCATLRTYLSSSDDLLEAQSSGRRILSNKLQSYFFWKGTLGKMTRNLAGLGTNNKFKANGSVPPAESAALKRKTEYKRGQPSYKRRRVRGGASTPDASTGSRSKKLKDEGAADVELLATEAGAVADLMDSSTISAEADLLTDMMPEILDEETFDEFFGLCSPNELVVIRPYNGDEDDRVLEELRPKYVVMYDADTSFVRRVEAYRALHPGLSLRTYFLVYSSSVEEQKYLQSIRREKESFEKLIRERSQMAITLEAEKRPGENEEEFLRTINSRIAGGSKSVRTDPPRVIVDVREFRSSLPSLLHASSFLVVPLTLTIGDYVISPEMCVERKSIPDLIQSFNSGRLYQQCELMTIYYKQPILLIEFDQKKSFSLETYSDPKAISSSTLVDTDLHAKLVLLTLTFPRLRIIWSSSAYETSDIFSDLKQQQEEPDPEKAGQIGADDNKGEGLESAFNQAPQDLLRSMPGITSKNYRYVMQKVKNLQELAEMDQQAVGELIGAENAKLLCTFLSKDSVKE